MTLVERGAGAPVVLVPGIQGRWEYMAPAIDALSRRCRVIAFSLRGERRGGHFTPPLDMNGYADQVGEALDRANLSRAAICGVSFGGLVALRFAARSAERTAALIMVSTPGPRWHLKRKHELYAKAPWLFGPVFLAESPARLRREIAVAVPDAAARRQFVRRQLRTLITAPLSVTRLAQRARLISSYDRLAECAAVAAPTLIVHGDPALDHVVSASGTSEYATLIDGARSACLDGTGHLGSITRPEEFARVVADFVEAHHQKTHDSAA